MPSAVQEFAGTLNTPIVWLLPSETGGDATVTDVVQGTGWAELRGISGTPLGLSTGADYSMTTYFRADLPVTSRWRIGIGLRRLELVTTPIDPTGRGERWTTLVREILP